jgi:hypothetical protein
MSHLSTFKIYLGDSQDKQMNSDRHDSQLFVHFTHADPFK